MAYPIKFREHVLKIQKEENLSYEVGAKRFKISKASLSRWAKRIEPKKVKSRRRKIDREKLKEDVEKYPYDYQWERARRFGVTQRSIHYVLKRLGVTYKKNPFSIRRQTLLLERHLKKK